MEKGLIQNKQVEAVLLSNALAPSTEMLLRVVFSGSPETSMVSISSKIDDVEISRPNTCCQLSKMRAMIGEENTRVLVMALILDLSDFFNTGKPMNDVQVEATADMILAEFWYLKLEQITRAFHLKKTGKMGVNYNRLDPATVIEILRAYDQNVINVARETEAVRHKEGYDPNRTSAKNSENVEAMRQAANRYVTEQELKNKK